jgi:hypothetical protein
VLTETLPREVELVGECAEPACVEFAAGLRDKVCDIRYQRGVSVMENPDGLEQWRAEHRTARKRAARAQRLGYWFSQVDYSQYDHDIFAINTSLASRQGRPMSPGYLEFTKHGKLDEYPCSMHRTITYGVLEADTLVAYMTLHRSGELALVSMILGHGDHLRNDVMYLLFQGMIADQAGRGGVLYYNRHDSGQDGLRYYKERVGFAEGDVEWIL